jgi:hypothetical protein
MDAASLGQNDQLAPAVLVLMLLLSVLRAAAARIQQAPSPMRAASASSHAPHAVRQPAPRPELLQLPPLPRPSRRPHAAPREPASPSARSAAPRSRSSEPRRRRGVVPLLLRPVAWVARVALSPVGVLGAVRVRLHDCCRWCAASDAHSRFAGWRRSSLPAPAARGARQTGAGRAGAGAARRGACARDGRRAASPPKARVCAVRARAWRRRNSSARSGRAGRRGGAAGKRGAGSAAWLKLCLCVCLCPLPGSLRHTPAVSGAADAAWLRAASA